MYKNISAKLVGKNKTFGIVISRFNDLITQQLLKGAIDCLIRHDVAELDIHVYWVPGAFEIPQVLKQIEKNNYNAIITLGALIRGNTPHFDIISNQVIKEISNAACKIPISFGVLTTDTQEQAIERAGSKAGNKGVEAALSALEMANLWDLIKKN